MEFNKLKKIISGNQSFLLTTHVNPDADAIGSEIAMYKLLQRLGKSVQIINHSITPYNLKFLDIDNAIEKYKSENHKSVFNSVDVIIALDFNKPDRMVSMQHGYEESDKIKVCIDHHQDSGDFADHYFIDENSSATGQIIYEFIKSANIVELDFEIAYPLYAAIMTDTGSFRFSRTTPELHLIISDLLNTGIDPSEVYDKIYDQSKYSKVKLLGRALNSLEIINDKIGYMYISRDDFNELGAIESDTDNFVNYTLSIENIVMGLLFIELNNGFKVSFRSKGNIPVSKLAANFGGGGHLNAAGARFHDLSMEKEYKKILKQSENFLIEHLKDYNV